jgi:hypothetical protein
VPLLFAARNSSADEIAALERSSRSRHHRRQTGLQDDLALKLMIQTIAPLERAVKFTKLFTCGFSMSPRN